MSANKDTGQEATWRLNISSEHKLRSENLAFDIDVWYPILKDFTFFTVFLPLKRKEAIAMIHYYQQCYIKNGDQSDIVLTPYDIEILKELEHEIDKLLSNKDYKFHVNGAFMRLCGRSPKDGEPLDRNMVRTTYNEQLSNLLSQSDNDNNDRSNNSNMISFRKAELKPYPNNANTKLIAIANTPYLKIGNGQEAMSILLSSERVYTDLHDWIRYGEPEQLVFRVWENELSLDLEFRVFVYNNKITAISQYDHYGVYPYLNDNDDNNSGKHKYKIKKHLKELMINKWKIIDKKILQDNYVVDFGYLESKDEMIVIEISPFRQCTGPACFNWKIDHDIMYGINKNNSDNDSKGNHDDIKQDSKQDDSDDSDDNDDNDADGIEFRLNETNHPQIEDLVDANWTMRWFGPDSDKQPYWLLYDKILQRVAEEDKRLKCIKCKKIAMFVVMAVFLGLALLLLFVLTEFDDIIGIIIGIVLFVIIVLSIIIWRVRGCNKKNQSGTVSSGYNRIDLRDPNYSNHIHLKPIVQVDEKINNKIYKLFVYGTLKRGFHWNHKFMSRGATFISNAITIDKYALIMGNCCVPYVLDVDVDDVGHDSGNCGDRILGELWDVDYETLVNLDDYEGVNKGHYKRKAIKIETMEKNENGDIVEAFIYMKASNDNVDLNDENVQFVKEYEYQFHCQYYSPIKHIQVKQLAYLGEDFTKT